MSLTREELIFLANITQKIKKFEDMFNHMKKILSFNYELTFEERNLFSFACKHILISRRTAWNAISSFEQKEESKGELK